ncbi:MAG: hypothetical protein WCO63_01260 [Bacteroidota bacterium]
MEVIQIKVYPEAKATYEKLRAESDAATAGAFFDTLMEAYQHPRKIEVSKPEDLATIAHLTETFDQLQDKQNGLLQEIESLRHQVEENAVLQTRISELEAAADELIAAAESAAIPSDCLVVKFDKMEMALLAEMAGIETKRVGKEVSPQIVVNRLVYHQIVDGPGDWLPRTYTRRELVAKNAELHKPTPEA